MNKSNKRGLFPENGPHARGKNTGSAGPGLISLGKRLRKSSIRCLGLQPNWDDYSQKAQEDIRKAEMVCYPGPVYAKIFQAAGKRVFPRNYYTLLGDKVAQTNLFQLLGISHPRTGIYHGRSRQALIERDFSWPFVAKTPVNSSQGKGVFLISSAKELSRYLEVHNPAYIQEYLPIGRDLRVVMIRGNIVNAYWRIHRDGDFRNNVSQGGAISFEGIPAAALDFAVEVAGRCRFDEVGLDICMHHGRYYVLEANMVFGLEGFHKKGLDIHEVIAGLFDTGEIR
ncbi:MAG: RimK family alpha-L-glutamate ligase [Syntrophobacteraceae bacterium]